MTQDELEEIRYATDADLGRRLRMSVVTALEAGHSDIRNSVDTYYHPTDEIGEMLKMILLGKVRPIEARWPEVVAAWRLEGVETFAAAMNKDR